MSITTSERARSSAPPPTDVDADNTADSRREFCRALKAARQRRGLTIAKIAETTKVCPSHFDALERGDLRLWPKGLYRRTFFRGYVTMVGLPINETVDEFVRLFPDDAAAPTSSTPTPPRDGLRIVLDDSWHGLKAPILSRIASSAIDAVAAVVPAIALAWLSGIDPALAIAVAVVAYFTIGTLCLGVTPGAWVWQRRSGLVGSWKPGTTTATVISLSTREPAGQFRMGEERDWTTDAHRIPRHAPPRMRVRFKWS